ncbi:MAG: cysteine desulfurase [Gammaproteobacteria bacterium]|nr:cysteine desulfurase [Gammaproteobacteria bacterium]
MIYLDHNATTPLAPAALAAMLPYLSGEAGEFVNPSSASRAARRVRSALEHARQQVADLVAAEASEVIFTSGGSEANNSVLNHLVFADAKPMLAVGCSEHPAVMLAAERLEQQGVNLLRLAADRDGQFAEEALLQWLETIPQRVRSQSWLSLIYANNETGVLSPVVRFSELCHRYGVRVHSDAVQAAGKVAVNFAASGLTALSLSAHKLYGPKGIGALVLRNGVTLPPLLLGGGQEQQRRAGTENVAAIIGFGAAAALAAATLASEQQRLVTLRQRFEQGLLARCHGALIFAQRAERLPNTTLFALPGVHGATLVEMLDAAGFVLSSGSACGSALANANPRLLALGYRADEALGAVRLSMGQRTTQDDIERLLEVLVRLQRQLGSMANQIPLNGDVR